MKDVLFIVRCAFGGFPALFVQRGWEFTWLERLAIILLGVYVVYID